MIFPNGIVHYVLGGVLIGAALAAIYVLTGIQAGSSGWFSSLWSKITKTPYGSSLKWRTIFTIATIGGGFLYALIFNDFFVTQLSWWKLLLGGILVGIGTRAAMGCTSGHGICGIGAINKSSIYVIIILMVVAIITGAIL
jgi:uncharacterized membrane protein YedE/YeeE